MQDHRVKKKLAIICSTDYKSYPMGGMMSFIVDILPYLNKDFEITLCGVSTENINVSEIHLQGETYPLRIFSRVKLKKKILPNILKVMINTQLKAKQILSEGYDILYFHGIPLSFPFLKKKNRQGFPKIVNHLHGIINPCSAIKKKIVNNSFMINLYDEYRKYVVQRSDLILVASDKQTYRSFIEEFDANTSQKIHCIPNFANFNIFKPYLTYDKIQMRELLNLPLDCEILINTGRLTIHKDPFLLLEAFKYLKKELNINALLFLIGDGELRSDLERKIKEMSIDDVKLLGRLEREQIASWLNASDVYVHTSFGEGFPIALVEAAMCGLPIVSTDVPGVHDLVIEDHTGYLARGRDYRDIAIKIKKALENRKRLSENIIELSKNYSISKISKKIIELFQDLF